MTYFESAITFRQFLQLLIHPETRLLAENIFDNPLNLPLCSKQYTNQNLNKGSEEPTHSTNTHGPKSGTSLGAVADWIFNASS